MNRAGQQGGHRYLIALGSNQRHRRLGAPAQVLAEAVRRLAMLGKVDAVAPVFFSAPVGPSQRRYANGAVVLRTPLGPTALLAALKQLEREFGRRAGGRRWSARVLDCDIILWSGGNYHDRRLTVPHRLFRTRPFVLQPAIAIAGEWRDSLTGFTVRQLHARLTRPRPATR